MIGERGGNVVSGDTHIEQAIDGLWCTVNMHSRQNYLACLGCLDRYTSSRDMDLTHEYIGI